MVDEKQLDSGQRELMDTGLPDVHRFLVQHYDLDELHTLCFDLGANYDDLAGTTLSSKARELILWVGRQHKLDQLLATMRDARRTPFDQAGLSLEPSEVEGLYGGLAAFESSIAPQSWWTRFRKRPWVFYPTLVFVIIMALVLLASGLVGIAGGVGGAQQQLQTWGLLPIPTPTAIPLAFAPAAKDEALIVIATFQQGQAVVDVGAQDEIRNRVRQAAAEAGFANLRAETEPTQLAADDQAGAQALGERYHASMVIWGAIKGTRVTVNYLNLKQPDFAARVTISETERTQLANPSAYAGFITQDLPGQMTFLSLFGLGQSFYSQERYSESIRAIEGAVASVESGKAVEGLGEAYYRLGWLYQFIPNPDNQRAIADYTKALDLKFDAFRAYNNRGIAKADSGDLTGAISDYTKAIELKPDDARPYNNRGNAKTDGGDLAGAITDYTKAIELKPDDASAYTNRGNARHKSGDFAGAIADHTKAVTLKPDDASAYNNRGLAKTDGGDLAGAIADCSKAIELKPDDARPYTNRGNAKAQSGDLAGAIADFDKAIELEPDLAEAYHNRGSARRDSGDLAGAIVDYTKAIELKPDLAEAYHNRGTVRRDSGDLAGAITDCSKAIDLKPDLAEAYNNRGIARADSGDLAGAIADYTEAIELEPDYASAYTNRGNARRMSGDLAGAIADHTEAVELKPGDADAYDIRGLARTISGDQAGAIADYTRAIDLKPAYADAYYHRGLARSISGDQAGAIADYDKAIELKPDLTEAYNIRGLDRSLSGDLAGAIADYTKVIELRPDYATAYNLRGNVRRDSGDLAGAIADYTNAVELAPDDAASLNSLCWTYALQQQAEQALPYCERAVKIDPQPACRDSRAVAYALLGRYEASIEDFQAYIEWLEQQPGAGNQAALARRKEWVNALRAGRNPFTPEVLAELRTEN